MTHSKTPLLYEDLARSHPGVAATLRMNRDELCAIEVRIFSQPQVRVDGLPGGRILTVEVPARIGRHTCVTAAAGWSSGSST